MYAAYFGLTERPFSLAPDPRYLFLSEGHREALAHLVYGLQGGGFVQLTGEVGTEDHGLPDASGPAAAEVTWR